MSNKKEFTTEDVKKILQAGWGILSSGAGMARDKTADVLKGKTITIRGKEIDLSEVVSGLNKEQFDALKESLKLN